ncbi:motile sperm domain-containing protein 2 [Rhinoraja longicauda]
MVIYEMPWIMNAAWKIVKTWLGPDALNLLKFANKTDVQEYINVEYLPAHMGGIDPFKYSYPPLPDDDFQTPLCENGPILGEDELDDKEKGNGNCKETVDANHSEESLQKPKKVSVDSDWPDLKIKSLKKPQTVFRGSLLHISPAEEIHFGSKESGETKCLIVLTNVTKSSVAFKVRTTAPDKYRVKPSNGSFEPGASMDILVSLHGGVEASPQDRFLVMAAEVNQAAGAAAPPDLTQFWKEVVRDQVMEHRLRCHVIESSRPVAVAKENLGKGHTVFSNQEDLHSKITKIMVSNRRLEEQIDRCLSLLQLLTGVVALLVAITIPSLYLQSSDSRIFYKMENVVPRSSIT